MAAEGEMGGWILSSLALRSMRPGSWIGFGAVIWMCPSWSPVYSILLSGSMSRGPADAASTCTLMPLASVSTDSRMTGLQAAAVDVHTGCNGRDDGVVGDRMGWSGRLGEGVRRDGIITRARALSGSSFSSQPVCMYV